MSPENRQKWADIYHESKRLPSPARKRVQAELRALATAQGPQVGGDWDLQLANELDKLWGEVRASAKERAREVARVVPKVTQAVSSAVLTHEVMILAAIGVVAWVVFRGGRRG